MYSTLWRGIGGCWGRSAFPSVQHLVTPTHPVVEGHLFSLLIRLIGIKVMGIPALRAVRRLSSAIILFRANGIAY